MQMPRSGRIYEIELCSGERRRWRCLGTSDDGAMMWCDIEGGTAFAEGGLMYAWRIIAEAAAPSSAETP